MPVTECSFKLLGNNSDLMIKIPKLHLDRPWSEDVVGEIRMVVDGIDSVTGEPWAPYMRDYPQLREEKRALEAEQEAAAVE